MNSTTQTKRTAQKKKRMTHLERTELSDSKMFEATEQLILTVGTQKLTLKEVGEKAGYSRGLANSRFGNKDELFLKLAARCQALWVEEVTKARRDKTGIEALLATMDAAVNYANGFPVQARVMYILWFESVGSSSEMKLQLAAFHAKARKDLSNLIVQAKAEGDVSADTDEQLIAITLTSTLFGLVYQYVVNPEAISLAELIQGVKLQLTAILNTSSK